MHWAAAIRSFEGAGKETTVECCDALFELAELKIVGGLFGEAAEVLERCLKLEELVAGGETDDVRVDQVRSRLLVAGGVVGVPVVFGPCVLRWR